jgi:hypothetical protein
MAVTTIIEKQEVGVTVSNDDFQLPVFMLGYAPRGPENENVYFSNYADFKKKFGNVAYYFKNPQYKDGNFYQAKGSVEKGFVFAHEYALTNKPGIFRRITKSNAPFCKLTPDVSIMTKTFLATKAYNNQEITRNNVVFSKSTSAELFVYTAQVDIVVDNVFGATTFNDESNNLPLFSVQIGDETYLSNDDSNGDLNVDANGLITLVTEDDIQNVQNGVVRFVSKVQSLTINQDASGIAVAINGNTVSDLDVERRPAHFFVQLPWGNETLPFTESFTPTGKVLQIFACTSGAWGTGIKVKIARVQQTNKLTVTVAYEKGSETESILGDLVYGGDYFIAGKDGTKVTTLLKITNGIIDTIGNVTDGLTGTEDSSMLFVQDITETALQYQGDLSADEITVQDIYNTFDNADFWAELQDKDLNDYAVFTTSGYPLHDPTDVNSKAAKQLQTIANYQLGFAVIDTRKRPQGQSIASEVELLLSDSATKPLSDVVAGVNSYGEKNEIYGAMFFDWRAYDTSFGRVELPASFAYVKALAGTGARVNQIKPWEALANDYGTVSVADNARLGGALSDLLQRNNSSVGVRVNPIQYLKVAGNRIMGNSTMANNQGELTNYSFLNIRVLTTIVKRFAYKLGNSLKYKTNDINTFLTFQSKFIAFANKIIDKGFRTEDNTGKRINPYGIDRLPSVEKGQIKINIWYYPLDAIEKVDESITLKDGYVSIGG